LFIDPCSLDHVPVAEAVAAVSPAALVWHDVLDSEQLAVLLSVVRCPLVLAR